MSAVNAAAPRVSRGYLDRIKQFPMLSAEEERELARRCRDHGDTAAADRLVTSHLRLVAKAAQKKLSSSCVVSRSSTDCRTNAICRQSSSIRSPAAWTCRSRTSCT